MALGCAGVVLYRWKGRGATEAAVRPRDRQQYPQHTVVPTSRPKSQDRDQGACGCSFWSPNIGLHPDIDVALGQVVSSEKGLSVQARRVRQCGARHQALRYVEIVSDRDLDRIIDVLPLLGEVICEISFVVGERLVIVAIAVDAYTHRADRNVV